MGIIISVIIIGIITSNCNGPGRNFDDDDDDDNNIDDDDDHDNDVDDYDDDDDDQVREVRSASSAQQASTLAISHGNHLYLVIKRIMMMMMIWKTE